MKQLIMKQKEPEQKDTLPWLSKMETKTGSNAGYKTKDTKLELIWVLTR